MTTDKVITIAHITFLWVMFANKKLFFFSEAINLVEHAEELHMDL